MRNPITPGQRRVVEALLSSSYGKTYPAVAKELGVGLGTVHTHLRRLRTRWPELYDEIMAVRRGQLQARHKVPWSTRRSIPSNGIGSNPPAAITVGSELGRARSSSISRSDASTFCARYRAAEASRPSCDLRIYWCELRQTCREALDAAGTVPLSVPQTRTVALKGDQGEHRGRDGWLAAPASFG
jgi:hypothetical protein